MRSMNVFAGSIIAIAILATSCKKEKCGEAVEGADAISEGSVPVAVRDSLSAQYPGLSATWYLEDSDYEVAMTVNGAHTTAIYTVEGVLLQVETEIAVADLPTDVAAQVSANYSGYTVNTAATIFIVASNETHYEAEVQTTDAHYDLIYDASANLLETIDLCTE